MCLGVRRNICEHLRPAAHAHYQRRYVCISSVCDLGLARDGQGGLRLPSSSCIVPTPPAPALCPQALCDMGYSASDIITTLFRVVRNFGGMNEYLKLEYIKVRWG